METATSWDKLTDALVGTYEDDILDGLLGAYQSLEGRIEVAYKAAQRPGASTFPLQRLLALRKELEGQLSKMKLPDSLKAKVIKALEDGQMAADYWAAIEINKIDPGAGVLGVEITPGMAQQNPEALVAAAQRQTALRNYALWEIDPKAAQVIDLIDKHAVDLRGRIMGAVEFHLAQADSWTSLRKTLRDSFKLTKTRAQMVARTEMSSAMITGKKMRYEAEGIEYIQIIATGSDRTCGYCAPRHNYVYEIGKVTVILHPNCRCTSIPWREEWVEQGLVDPKADAQSRKEVLEDLKAAGKEPINGPAPFERSLGLDEAPKPFWKPPAISKPKRKTRRKAKQVETPKAESPKDFLGLIAERVATPSRSTVKGGDVQRLFEELKGRDGLEGEAMDKVLKFMEQEKTSVLFTGTSIKTRKQADYLIKNKAFRESLARDAKRRPTGFSAMLHNSLEQWEDPESRWNLLVDQLAGDVPLKRREIPYELENLKNAGTNLGHTYKSASFITVRAMRKNEGNFNLPVINNALNMALEAAAENSPEWTVGDHKTLGKGQKWIPVLFHELGHVVYFAQGPESKLASFGLPETRIRPPVGIHKKRFRISKYGRVNADELFAESFCAYALAPTKLKEVSPETFEWVENVLDKVLK